MTQKQFDIIARRFDGMEDRFESLESKMDHGINQLRRDNGKVDQRVAGFASHFADLEENMEKSA